MANDTMPVTAAGENQLHALYAENVKLHQAARAMLAAWERWFRSRRPTVADVKALTSAINSLRELTQ